MNPPIASAVYEGVLHHHRHVPRPHRFGYRIAQLYLDLDEIEYLLWPRWLWSVNHRNLAEFRRSDYLGPPTLPLKEAVYRKVHETTGMRLSGPVRLLTHLRYGGYIFNPVSFYYCYESDGETLACIVAEVTNTPWQERHAYVLPVGAAAREGGDLRWRFDKALHVSPFLGMDRAYDWRFAQPGQQLSVHMCVSRDEHLEFDATLNMTRHALNGASLARVLWRYPLMTIQVITAIHWQALRLWLKRTPVYDHAGPA